MESKKYLAQSALRKELLKIFSAPRFDKIVNDLSISLSDDVIDKVKKSNYNIQDFIGAARNVLADKLSTFIINNG